MFDFNQEPLVSRNIQVIRIFCSLNDFAKFSEISDLSLEKAVELSFFLLIMSESTIWNMIYLLPIKSLVPRILHFIDQ